MGLVSDIIVLIFLVALSRAALPKESDEKPINKSDIEIIYLNVISTVQARFATTLITSQVANRADTAKEVTFTAQLPDQAFISNFSMHIGEDIIYGNVKDKDQAKADFDAAKARGESTGLVAKKPRETNSFTISVNVAAQSKVKFNLTYQELLKRVHGVYKQIINLQPEQPVSELKVDVFITERGEIAKIKVPKFGEKAGEKTNKELLAIDDEPNVVIKPIIKSNGTNSIQIHYQPKSKTKAEVFNGQLVVLYDVKRDNSAGDIEVVNGYFVHFFAPAGLKKRPKDIVFVLDKSGSMQGRKMAQLKDAMKTILNDLNSNDTFQIIFFSDKPENWRGEFLKATPETVKAAISFVGDTLADGGTNIYDSLQEAIKLLKKSNSSNVPMILLLTDGEATVGNTNPDEIVNATTTANDQERKIIIHGVAFGDYADYRILQKISGRNKGLARRVYEDSDSSLQLAGFYEEISSPLLTNVKIDYLNETVDVSSVVQDSSNNYYDGSEMVVVGKLKDENVNLNEINAKVSGQGLSGNDVAMVSRSSPAIVCRQAVPATFLNYDAAPSANAEGTDSIERPIWCCPPPYCCYWGECQSQSTPPPKEPLPATSVGGFVERMWAYQTIKKLLKDIDLEDNKKEGEESKKKALELSLKYHFVTDLTSMVVVKPNETASTPLEKNRRPSFGGPFSANAGSASANAVASASASASASAFGSASGSGRGSASGSAVGSAVPNSQLVGGFEKSDQSQLESTTQIATTIKPPDCTMEIIFVRKNSSLSNVRFAEVTIRQMQSLNNISARAALVDSFGPQSYRNSIMAPLSFILDNINQTDEISFINNFTLALLLDTMFFNYSAPKVKRYVIFGFVEPLQEFIDAAQHLRSQGVGIYAVSFSDDRSSDFEKTLESIAGDKARVFRASASLGKELSNDLAQCLSEKKQDN